MDIGAVEGKTVAKTKLKGEVTLDSGAGASCWPKGWLKHVKMWPKKKGVKFMAAQGTEMEYCGRKFIKFRGLRSEDGKIRKGNLCEMEFHVTDATKALASAAAVVEAGNDIVLSNRKGGSYIMNIKTQEKIFLKKKGGTFVFDVEFEGDEEEGDHMDVDESKDAPFHRRG